jgi:hypothetical protein
VVQVVGGRLGGSRGVGGEASAAAVGRSHWSVGSCERATAASGRAWRWRKRFDSIFGWGLDFNINAASMTTFFTSAKQG